MKNIRFCFILASISFTACKNDLPNKSNLKFSKGDNFLVDKIVEGFDGNIYCSGIYRDPMHTSIQINKLRVYNKKLELLSEFNSKYPALAYIGDKGWILWGYKDDTLSLYLTDKNMGIIRRVPFFRPGANSFGLNLSPMKGGDFILSSTIKSAAIGYNCSISRLSGDLNIVWDYRILNDSVLTGSDYILAKEASDGTIFYTTLVYIHHTPTNTNGVLVGSLNPGGVNRFQRVYRWGLSCIPVGMIFSGDKTLLSTISTSVSISGYWLTLFNSDDGIISLQKKLPTIYDEYTYKKEIVTAIDRNDFGFFLENKQLHKLSFLRLNGDLDIVNTFPLSIPSFESGLSNNRIDYCYTSRGTIIVGTTYENNGTIDFNLQEITTDGKVVR